MNDLSSVMMEPGIVADQSRSLWALVTEHSTYALGVTKEGLVINLHWGPRLATLADLPDPSLALTHSSHDPALTSIAEEYPGFGGLRYGELAAQVVFADGVRDLDLRYERAELLPDSARLPGLTLSLHDRHYPLTLLLRYQLDLANDLIIRSAAWRNEGDEPIRLERAFSAAWHLPHSFASRTLTTLAGQWVGESQIQRRPLVAGTSLVESRRGITSLNAAPWLAIESEPMPGQLAPEVYFASLAWSGNWMIRVNCDVTGKTTVVGGISAHDFAWQLAAGETFTTPDFVAGFADNGLNGARQRLHRYVRETVLPTSQALQPRPVLYNSWEATTFDVSEQGQIELAELAARLGVELFVVDDGWFLGRVSDTTGLGDWRPDPRKFPLGLGPLIERVHDLGMAFGLWVEPEMVNPDSELYRAHPDWVYAFPTRARSEARNQLVLNLGREDVRSYLFEALNRLLTEHSIAYLKWDMNRPISEPGWADYLAQGGEARELWVRHTHGVYALMDALRAHHPSLSIESCASGGGRADLAILRRTDQVWTSDNTHPEARLLIQEGFSLALPARVMGAWVTDAGRGQVPLAFRFHVSMLGALGVGGNLIHWSAEEMDEAASWIAIYKQIRHLVQDGEQSWLLSPHATRGQFAAVQYASQARDQALVFFFRRDQVFGGSHPPLRLCHLKPNALYRIEPLRALPTASPLQGYPTVLSGAALMATGLPPLLDNWQTHASYLVKLTEITVLSTWRTHLPEAERYDRTSS
jgi:alpha-galactosidase